MPGMIEFYQKFKALVERVEALESRTEQKVEQKVDADLATRLKALENKYVMLNARVSKRNAG